MDIRVPIEGNYGEHLAKFGDLWSSQVEQLKAKFGDVIEEVRMPIDFPTDLPTIFVKKERIVEVIEFAKNALEYGYFSDLTAIDEETDPRFEVVYHLFSHSKLCRIRFKVRVKDGEEVPTLCGVWTAANWAEREVWDMFGIKFTGHPDLRRILMDERWVGHPLRKDYPLRGYQIFPSGENIDPKLLDY